MKVLLKKFRLLASHIGCKKKKYATVILITRKIHVDYKVTPFLGPIRELRSQPGNMKSKEEEDLPLGDVMHKQSRLEQK